MLKGIPQQRLLYRSPILKRKGGNKASTTKTGVPDRGDSPVPKANRGLCWLEGEIFLLWSAGSFSKLINTIYKWGGEARETELLSCGDAGCVWMGVVYSTSNTVGRIAWRGRA